MRDLTKFMELVFRNVKQGVDTPLLVDAADGYQGRRWKAGTNVDGRTLYACISSVRDVPRANILSRKTEDLVATHAVVLDDVGTKVRDEDIKLDPSFVIETSPGNYQYWYLLVYPADPARAAALIEGIAAAGLTDPGAKRADRIVRVPGSVNRKESLSEPFEARVVDYQEGLYYTLSEIETGLGVTSTEPRAPRSDRPPSLEEGETDPVFDWLRDHGHVIDGPNPRGWYAIHCPWEAEHTGQVDHGTDYLPGKPGVFKCLHSHGNEIDNTSIRQWIEDQDPGADLGAISKASLKAVATGLQALIPEGGTMFGAPPPAAAPAPPVGPDSSLVQRLAAAIENILLDPQMLPDFDTNANGTVKRGQTVTAVRVQEVMRRIRLTARWNSLTKLAEAVFPDIDWYDPQADLHDAALETLIHACARCCMRGRLEIAGHFMASAAERTYSPVLEWMDSVPWDGVDRIAALAATLTMRGTEPWRVAWRDRAVRRWLVQGAVAATNAGRGADAEAVGFVLVLQGKQKIGKSRWVSSLMPKKWVADGISMKP